MKHNLVPKRGQHEDRRNFFCHRVIESWNSLPKAVRDFPRPQYWRHLETMAAPAMLTVVGHHGDTALKSQEILIQVYK